MHSVPCLLSVALAAQIALAAPASPVADQRVDVSGHSIHYLEAGSGPPIVFLHGLGADARAWRLVLPALASRHHVYAVDFLGFGQSDKPQIDYRVSTLSAFVGGFLDAAKIPRATLVGHSLGGWVAARFASEHPGRIDRLVLVDSAGYREDQDRLARQMLSQMDPASAAAAEQFVASIRAMTPQQRQTVRGLAVAYFSRRLSRPDGYALASLVESLLTDDEFLGPELKQIAAPTLVIWGRNDTVMPLRAAEAFASDIAGAKKVVLDGCGHRPELDCPRAFTAALRDFLDRR